MIVEFKRPASHTCIKKNGNYGKRNYSGSVWNIASIERLSVYRSFD